MKNFNNKILIVALLGLVVVFVLTKIFREPGRKSNLDLRAFELDTASVTEIRLHPRKDTSEVTLRKTEKGWMVFARHGNGKAEAREIMNLLTSLKSLKPERIITRKKENWKQYAVSDSAAVVVKALRGDDELLDLKIGKESAGTTYARIGDEDEVYALEGYLHDVFDRKISDWRDQTFLHITTQKVDKIVFTYPADSGFVLEKKNGQWLAANEPADSAKVQDYLNSISAVEHDLFATQQESTGDATVSISITHEGGKEIIVKGWRKSFDEWILHSSVQPGTWFLDRGPKLARDIFIGKSQLQ